MEADVKPNNVARRILTVHCINQIFWKFRWAFNAIDITTHIMVGHHTRVSSLEWGMITFVGCCKPVFTSLQGSYHKRLSDLFCIYSTWLLYQTRDCVHWIIRKKRIDQFTSLVSGQTPVQNVSNAWESWQHITCIYSYMPGYDVIAYFTWTAKSRRSTFYP